LNQKKSTYIQQIPTSLLFFEIFLIQNELRFANLNWNQADDIKGLFVSKRITYVDLYGWDTLSLHMGLQPTILDSFPRLKNFFYAYCSRFKITYLFMFQSSSIISTFFN